ncbi:PTS sugar transporter subunit IIA [Anaerosalibacter massiliensis]|uniref:PTS sugar transporter subunit IIA n=1 Tax=Anaerosalibacter massiliensis TaxID=1347392 RepID=A0A9X2MIW2_9FIRM|nr:PTS sugar transporter subunit IIA [Anaerosalibacter massiliensis]MCR2044479.1 PTS sugar transporter subunit IIA [Anaerosalibacter massiliensis]
MEIAKYVKKELVDIEINCENKDELFNKIYEEAFKNKYVKKGFLKKIRDREEKYPTGIELSKYSVAIPHTDAELVNEQFISINILKNPISFNLMDDSSKKTDVSIVFVLGLNKPDEQLIILKEMIALIQNENIINGMLNAKSESQILEIIQQGR